MDQRDGSDSESDSLRSEMYGAEQLKRFARSLAGTHDASSRPAVRDTIRKRLADNERVLDQTYELLNSAVKQHQQLVISAEWLLDNYYLIKENIQAARKHLPRAFNRELPRLTQGAGAGTPRVYAIASELVARVDGNIDLNTLSIFLSAYQSVRTLTLGELWAVPIMLRFALIERLRRIAVRIAKDESDRAAASHWAERMAAKIESKPSDLILVLADLANAKRAFTPAFVAELKQQLQGQGPHYAFALSWLEHRMAERGQRIDQFARLGSYRQASDQISIGNSVTSLRLLVSANWRDFVEAHSVVEQVLLGDPAGVYRGMDFGTRDQYRHQVERIARYAAVSEEQVARAAVQLAGASLANQGAAPEDSHIGSYLLGERAVDLRKAVASSPPMSAKIARELRRHAVLFYLACIVLLTAAIAAAGLIVIAPFNLSLWLVGLFAVPLLVSASQLAISVLGWFTTHLLKPRALPRMDFSRGIPSEFRSIVVMPTLLTGEKGIGELLERIELHYLANRDANLSFALLTDYKDAKERTAPDDARLLSLAVRGIERLNATYGNGSDLPFLLFHRPRVWNDSDQIWMGLERKRGKLADFNATVLDGRADRFEKIVGDSESIQKFRYAITLDADTHLPREAAWKLVGTMAHPLNRPAVHPRKCRIAKGYGILQPRVSSSLHTATRSLFSVMFGMEPGIDPYTRVVSDIYQDLFGEGSFIGKGIYDIRAFAAICEPLPNNLILSHDLIESAYARSGVVSDVEVFEEYPNLHFADQMRRHRWVRGDWQILWWLFPRVPTVSGSWVRNPISLLSWWKIFDNVRRSLYPVCAMVVLLGAWALPLGPFVAACGTFFVFTIEAAPHFLAAIHGLAGFLRERPVTLYARTYFASLVRRASAALFAIGQLPFEAQSNLDALLRSLGRMLITRKRLLEWTTAKDAERAVPRNLLGVVLAMWVVPVIAMGTIAFISVVRPENLTHSLPMLLMWTFAPVLSWVVSAPRVARMQPLSDAPALKLRVLARRTWCYFDELVSQEDHWLPPDNYQVHPEPVIASRTSPTNIGLALLANLSACDFGYCSPGGLLRRTQQTFGTLDALDRYQGHFYNWYDTRTLKPLQPQYISTVDSGNLALHLLILRQGLLELPERRIFSKHIFDGLRDTFSAILETIDNLRRAAHDRSAESLQQKLASELSLVVRELETAPDSLSAAASFLVQLQRRTAALHRLVDNSDANLCEWFRRLDRQVSDHIEDLYFIAPWMNVNPLPDAVWTKGGPEIVRRVSDIKSSLGKLDRTLALRDVETTAQQIMEDARGVLQLLQIGNAANGLSEWLSELTGILELASQRANERISAIDDLASDCASFAQMDFTFLYDEARSLFSIGYNATAHRLDNSFYDLLASEARVSSFIAIAQNQIDQKNWFTLGRPMTTIAGTPVLVSWSGSMFEYLMPSLVMPTYENTLLAQTARGAVQAQISYAKQRGIPWGISESAFSAVDAYSTYQYKAFGVPGLGVKRGLADDLVVAPYASVMALIVEPVKAFKNIERLIAEGHIGRFGLYEAIDYTPARLPPDEPYVTVKTFMGHHQGMSLLALAQVLLGQPMQRRFSADPMLCANELLLQERAAHSVSAITVTEEASLPIPQDGSGGGNVRIIASPTAPIPEVQLLSNGRYHVMITSSGCGYSNWRDIAVTRWREDATTESTGSFCYVRDLDNGKFWSTTYQPTLRMPRAFEAQYGNASVEFRRVDDEIECRTRISVSPEDDVELRRTTVTNLSGKPRTIELTSYAEVVLASAAQDLSHPAFSGLFVQSEILSDQGAIFCTRRQRHSDERPPWLVHMMSVRGKTTNRMEFETDRSKFIGRGRNTANPAAMDRHAHLTESAGAVLDPIVSIRCVVRLQPDESAEIDLITGACESRDLALVIAEKYNDSRLADRLFGLAWTSTNVELRHLGIADREALMYSKLAGSVLFATAHRRANPEIIARNTRGQSGLWGYGISGDIPIVLLRMSNPERITLVQSCVRAHALWRSRGLNTDLVIWVEDSSVYRQELHDLILGTIASSSEAGLVDKPGGIFVRRLEQISEEDRTLFLAIARVVISDEEGSLRRQIERVRRIGSLPMPRLSPMLRRHLYPRESEPPKRDLAFYNGTGGFTQDGREYIITLRSDQWPPAPWVNVIANPNFGTVVSESGSVYTWVENAHELRITPWQGDTVGGAGGEAIYIRDEESGKFWSPTPFPARSATPYVVRHGFGYTVFEHTVEGIASELIVFVSIDANVKYSRLKIRNMSGRPRKLSVTGYCDLVLAEHRTKSYMHIVSEIDTETGAIFSTNSYNTEFGGRVAFFACSAADTSVTADRTEFIGRNGTMANPAGMHRVRLGGHSGAGLDPCAAIQASVQLENDTESEVAFSLGAERSHAAARELVRRSQGTGAAQSALEDVWRHWGETLGAVHVDTPNTTLNYLANGWLLYQTISARMWGRTGFYQSGGAYGFRDQLQDAMALVHADPAALRTQILRAASRQFHDGDVQHWWHAHTGRGVRTRCSDDFLWLPLATARYVEATGDTGILDEQVAFLEGRPLRPDEESYYDLPQQAGEIATLYEHCVRAIHCGMRFGTRGLPLIGSGDWNDGMNLVGIHGKGESVWLAQFFCEVLTQFAAISRLRDDRAFVDTCLATAESMRLAVEREAWDGAWYLRAFFDNGEPLGSAVNQECQIDALPQAWSALSGMTDTQRIQTALRNLAERLVRNDAGIIQLLDPPFERAEPNPGYIKGYLPGVRENGGQYTHAAIWTIMAFAKVGDAARAWQLFSLINPIRHGASLDDIKKYKVEPYVVAADVYSAAPHTGRGGWTWYTGSAGWMYRLILESLLGITRHGNSLQIKPCLPAPWDEYRIHYRFYGTQYHIEFHSAAHGSRVARIVVDGEEQREPVVQLLDDHQDHQVVVEIA
ncbi:MAG: cyclic beta 1-2 glucan synthetase [Candidatus Hydrogenedentes bacterium]|nr:cyclic beta 1-2 glucan synthetase [Candidatus Hydrogenedentota bacterium]